jgi:hypothetical protein
VGSIVAATVTMASQAKMMLKPASFRVLASRHPAEAGCRTDARRKQATMMMEQVSSPRATARTPAEADWLPDCGPLIANDDGDEAGELLARRHSTLCRNKLYTGKGAIFH